jgi:hypothetical protein
LRSCIFYEKVYIAFFSGHDFELGNNAFKLSTQKKIVFDRKLMAVVVYVLQI